MLNFESKTLLPCFGQVLPSRSCEINQRLFIPNSATADPSNDRQKFVSPSTYTGTRHRPESNQSFSPPLSNTQRNRGTRKQLGGNPRARRPEFIIKKRRAGAGRPPLSSSLRKLVHQYSSGDAPLRIATMSGSLLYISQHPAIHPATPPSTVIRSLSRLFKGCRASLRK